MRKIIFGVAVALSAILVASCGVEKMEPVVDGAQTTTISATIEDQSSDAGTRSVDMTIVNPDELYVGQMPVTKVSLGDNGKLTWTEGDQIAVLTENGAKIPFKLKNIKEDGVAADFEGNLGGSKMKGIAYFPYHKDHDEIAALLPASYVYNANTINAIMRGEMDENGRLKFKHLGAMLRVNYVDLPAGFMTFTVTTDAPITGKFEVIQGAETKIISTPIEYATKTVTYTLTDKKDGTVEGDDITFYVPLPIQNYKSFTVTLSKPDGTQFTKTLTHSTGLTPRVQTIITFPELTLDYLVKGKVYEVYNYNGLKAAVKAMGVSNEYSIKLMKDIEVPEGETLNIATLNSTFDGNGMTISKLNQSLPLVSTLGGTIENLTLSNCNIVNTSEAVNIGAFAGENKGTIENCVLTSNSLVGTKGGDYNGAGGIAGESTGIIRGCRVEGSSKIYGAISCGGIAGVCGLNAETVGCIASYITVDGASESGGIIGYSEVGRNKVTAAFCVTTTGTSIGDNSNSTSAGIVGYQSSTGSKIISCYSGTAHLICNGGGKLDCYSNIAVNSEWQTAVNQMNTHSDTYGYAIAGGYATPRVDKK